MILRGTFLIDPTNIDAYRIIATIYKKNERSNSLIYSTNASNPNGVNKDTFNNGLNNILEGAIPIIFQTNDKLVCEFEFLLDGASATQAHQGNKINCSFTVEAKQNV